MLFINPMLFNISYPTRARGIILDYGTASMSSAINFSIRKAGFKRRTSHEPNRMLMRKNKGFFSFAFDSAHVKYGI